MKPSIKQQFCILIISLVIINFIECKHKYKSSEENRLISMLKTKNVILGDWFTISSKSFSDKKKFPSIETPEGRQSIELP